MKKFLSEFFCWIFFAFSKSQLLFQGLDIIFKFVKNQLKEKFPLKVLKIQIFYLDQSFC
ncbi:hypothetical protein pb186bvf_018012 [Paramecium bursaria]